MSGVMLRASLLLAAFTSRGDLAATPADRVRFPDGQVLLCQVVEPAPAGKLWVLARREWVQANLPERWKFWTDAEAQAAGWAIKQRRGRLEAWRRELPRDAEGALPAWLDAELARLGAPADGGVPTRLMNIELDRRMIQGVDRVEAEDAVTLRQAWRAGLREPESRVVGVLRNELEGRGFAVNGQDRAPVDDLAGLLPEPEQLWRLRRAATEVRLLPGARFLRAMGLVLPEEGEPGPGALAAAASGALRQLLGEDAAPAPDPLEAELRRLEASGHTGALLTSLEMAPDQSAATVTAVLLVRSGREQWVPALRYPATVRTDAVRPEELVPLSNDVRVQGAFRAVESLGLGAVGAEARARSLGIGAATRQALGIARSRLEHELDRLALPARR